MDEVTALLADQRSVMALIQTCKEFGQTLGAKVNFRKLEAMLFLFVEWALTPSDLFPFSIQLDFIKILVVCQLGQNGQTKMDGYVQGAPQKWKISSGHPYFAAELFGM